jgi:hypothetical protein
MMDAVRFFYVLFGYLVSSVLLFPLGHRVEFALKLKMRDLLGSGIILDEYFFWKRLFERSYPMFFGEGYRRLGAEGSMDRAGGGIFAFWV